MQEPDTFTLRRLSVEFDLDPRTIKKELRAPGSVAGSAGRRARAAIARWRTDEVTSDEQQPSKPPPVAA
jgi:hypothetical protein